MLAVRSVEKPSLFALEMKTTLDKSTAASGIHVYVLIHILLFTEVH
jgi:hypothetical protein